VRKDVFIEDLFSLYDIASGISEAIDIVTPQQGSHHKRVAYISYCLAKEMKLSNEDINDIVLGAILHDIGVFTKEEQTQLVQTQFNDSGFDHHQIMGYRLLKDFTPFSKAASLIKDHHVHFAKTTNEVPLGCHIIHLADRVSILVDFNSEILQQIPGILERVDQNRTMFHPEALDALYSLSKMEYFWIEAFTKPFRPELSEIINFPKRTMEMDTIRELARIVARIIDFRSRFTATHSCGVAAVSYILSALSGFSERECMLMEVAGFLHDLGKMSVSNEIIEKTGALNIEEFNELRKHSYFTYSILSKIKGFEEIAEWAAYHHERLDGNGYPFHVKGDGFTKLARIVAVADIVTAITENRPYRIGMNSEKALDILYEMVQAGSIDKGLVDLVRDNFPHIDSMRIKAQQEEMQEYIAMDKDFNLT